MWPRFALSLLLLCAGCASSGGRAAPGATSTFAGTARGFDPCKVSLAVLSRAVGTPVERGPSFGDNSFNGIREPTCQFQASESDDVGFVEVGSYIGARADIDAAVRRYCRSTTPRADLPAGSFVCTADPFTSVFVAAPDPFTVIVGAEGGGTLVRLEVRAAKAVLAER
jgi:hypothetical protein